MGDITFIDADGEEWSLSKQNPSPRGFYGIAATPADLARAYRALTDAQRLEMAETYAVLPLRNGAPKSFSDMLSGVERRIDELTIERNNAWAITEEANGLIRELETRVKELEIQLSQEIARTRASDRIAHAALSERNAVTEKLSTLTRLAREVSKHERRSARDGDSLHGNDEFEEAMQELHRFLEDEEDV